MMEGNSVETLALNGILHQLVWDDKSEELNEILTKYKDAQIKDIKENDEIPFIDAKYRGTTALGLAAQLGRVSCIEVLLHHWADTLESSDYGYFPLQEAVSFGDREIIKMLLLRRHEQVRQLWKVRQPSLAEALHSELPNFFLEMDWHFKSWVPLLARLCPSDKCRIWKKGRRLRVDSTLMGVEVDKLNWQRGNISFLFHVDESDSKMFILDHDKKLVEEIDKMADFTKEEIEEDINLRLNSQIYCGKVKRPLDEGGSEEKRVKFIRQQAGLFGMGGDKEEEVGPYQTRVYDIPNVQVIAKYRKEHLLAREVLKKESREISNEVEKLSLDEEENSSLDSYKVLKDLENSEAPQVESLISDSRKGLYDHVPSLPAPSQHPLISREEYFSSPSPYLHAGRYPKQSEKSKTFKVSVWMADNFPLTVKQLMPFLEIMSLGNKNFEKVQQFIAMDLPPGFPVRIEIPLFAFLSAQITFLNFQFWNSHESIEEKGIPRPLFGADEDWFDIPKDYKEGIVIKNILKDE